MVDKTQPLELARLRTVRRLRRRSEPALVNPASMAAVRIKIVRMQLQPPARNHKGARHPVRFQPENPSSVAHGVTDLVLVQHFRWIKSFRACLQEALLYVETNVKE